MPIPVSVLGNGAPASHGNGSIIIPARDPERGWMLPTTVLGNGAPVLGNGVSCRNDNGSITMTRYFVTVASSWHGRTPQVTMLQVDRHTGITWQMCDMCDPIDLTDMYISYHISYHISVDRLSHITYMSRYVYITYMWHVISHITYLSRVCHTFISGTSKVHVCDINHSSVGRETFTSVRGFICMCDSFMCVICVICHTNMRADCDMSHSSVSHTYK